MSLEQTIDSDLKVALKEKNTLKLDTLRMLKSALHNKVIELKKETLDEKEVTAIIQKEVKKRQDSIEAFKQADRQELADKEAQEADILSAYLPEMLSEEEIAKLVDEVISSGQDNFGLIMKEVMAKAQGQADGQVVQKLVKAKLGQ